MEKKVRSFRIDETLLKRLEAYAQQEDRTLSYVIEKAVKEYLDAHEHER